VLDVNAIRISRRTGFLNIVIAQAASCLWKGVWFTMGLTKVTTKMTAMESPQGSYEELCLVDTGATDCMVPCDALDKIGVRRLGKMSYELADGTVREFPYGLVRIEFRGEITAGRVIFGDSGCEPLLGVTALESVGIVVDPADKTLKRLPAIPLK